MSEQPDEPQPPDEGDQPQPPDGDQPQPPDEGTDARVQELIAKAARLYDQAQEALTEGDLEEYGRLIERLGRLLDQAEELSGAGGDDGGGADVPEETGAAGN